MRVLSALAAVLALALPALALAEPDRDAGHGAGPGAELRQQRLARSAPVPSTETPIPAGELTLSPGLAYAAADTTLRLTAKLDREVARGAVLVTLPRRFTQTPSSGIPYAGAPQLRRDAGGHGRLRHSGQTVTLDLASAAAGSEAGVAIDVQGLPAGTYALPVRWRDGAGGTHDAGTLSFTLLARTREGGEGDQAESAADPFGRLQAPRIAQDASNTSGNEESETWVAVAPQDPQRVLAAGNDIGPSGDGRGGFFLSDDGGSTWKALEMPQTFRLSTTTSDTEMPGGDPIAAADDLGNIWVGGLSLCSSSSSRSHIYVNRIAAGTDTPQAANAAIPFKTDPGPCSSNPDGIQDKPQLTIDNNRASPTYGRLYATWDDLTNSGDVNEVISACDTRTNGYPDAARCDTGSGWSTPAVITDRAGSYITSDVAVGPDGTVYVAWWDYSAANKISIDKCTPSATACTSWGTDKTIAVLESKSGAPVPFACPILAQPGGRAAPVPSLAVAGSGRIYVAWSDLRAGSGLTRCSELASGDGAPPLGTHETWDSYVATAPDYATLTGAGTQTSAQEGTRVVTDTGTSYPSTANSDDWFPWVAVDQSTGNAYVDYYSTQADADRRQTHFYIAAVTPPAGGTQPAIATPAAPLNATASDYSDDTCCQFQNDYGDYTGLAAAQGLVYPVWTQRSAPVSPVVYGEVDVDRPVAPGPRLTPASVSLTEGPSADGDGKVEPGEDFVLSVTLKNTSASAPATGVTATATGVSPRITLTSDATSYADIAPGASQAQTATITGHLDAAVPCTPGAVDLRYALSTGQGARTVQFAVPICDATPPPVTTPTTPTTTTTTTTPAATTTTTGSAPPPPATTQTPPPATAATTTTTTPTATTAPRDTTAPSFALRLGKRASLKLSRTFGVSFGAFAEPVRATLVMRTAKRYHRRHVTLLRFTRSSGAGRPLRLVARVGKTARGFLLRHRSLPVVLTVTVRDLAGNHRTRTARFTLRSRR